MTKTYLYSRKHDKEEYKFFLVNDKSWLSGKEYQYIMVEAPENCFGYPDYIHLTERNGVILGASGTHRYHPKWILDRLCDQMIAAQAKFCENTSYC